jgi:hypothetical protein
MALGKRKRERQLEAFVTASDLPRSPGHPFYTALKRLLAENTSTPLSSLFLPRFTQELWGVLRFRRVSSFG